MRHSFAIIAVLFLSAGIAACAANQSDRSRRDRAVQHLNSRDYEKAIEILEGELHKHPEKKTTALLLAQAHLGASHLEMFDVVKKVMEPQNRSRYVMLKETPDCDDGEITQLAGLDFRCVLFRALQALPNPDDPHFARARQLLREAYPDPHSAPSDVNFLGAFVELSSVLGRIRTLAGKDVDLGMNRKMSAAEQDQLFRFVLRNSKRLTEEAMAGVRRLRYSYGKLSNFVTSHNGFPLLKIGARTFVFREDMELSDFLRFLSGALFDYGGNINTELNRQAGFGLNQLGYGFLSVLRKLDLGVFNGRGRSTLVVSWQFQRAVEKLLTSAADSLDTDGRFNFFEIAWRNPPRILRLFAGATGRMWSLEDPAPLREYFAATSQQWDELHLILGAWESWFGDLTGDQRSRILELIAYEKRRDPALTRLPEYLGFTDLSVWESEFVGSWKRLFRAMLTGRHPESILFSSSQIEKGLELLDQSDAWFAANLWTVK